MIMLESRGSPKHEVACVHGDQGPVPLNSAIPTPHSIIQTPHFPLPYSKNQTRSTVESKLVILKLIVQL